MSTATEALIAAVAAALPSSSPLPSSLTPLSSPFPHIPSPPLPLPSPPLPLLAPSSPLLLPATDRMEDVLEADVPPRKRLCLTSPAPRFEVGESSAAAAARQLRLDVTYATDYSFINIVDATPKRPMSREASYGITDDRALQRSRVNMLFRDRRYHLHTAMLLESEARHARQAWSHAMDCNRAVHAEHLAYLAEVKALHEQIKNAARKTTTTTTPMTDASIKALIAQGVADALDEYEAHRSSRNGDDSHDSGSGRRTKRAVRNNCTVACQIKFATYTLPGNALTWWNSHVKTVSHEVAYGMTWKTLKKIMTDKYCLRGEIKKLEIELMFPEESNEVEKYVGELSDMIQGSVMASKPKTMQDAIEFATELMDQKIRTFADHQVKNKRKLDDNSRSNQNQQQPFKRKNVARAYTAGPREKKCAPKCNNCKRTGHLARDYRSPAVAANNQRAPMVNQRVVTCFECGVQGHYKKDYPKLKNNNHGNQAGNGRATTRAYAMGN
ncbi:putative reverse transcriptase domain-containing protein [Tanacetum coccineum]